MRLDDNFLIELELMPLLQLQGRVERQTIAKPAQPRGQAKPVDIANNRISAASPVAQAYAQRNNPPLFIRQKHP